LSEPGRPRSQRTNGWFFVIALGLIFFSVRTIQFWIEVSQGRVAFGDLSIVHAIRVGFIHAAVVIAIVGLVEILRERRSGAGERERSGAGVNDGRSDPPS
jgi:hypothetical protein